MNKRWLLPFIVLLLLAVVGVAVPYEAPVPAPDQQPIVPGDVAWMLTASGLVLLMTPGLAFFYGGMVSYKNIVSTMLQSFIAMAVISLLWMAVGFSIAFGDSIGGDKTGIIGNPFTFFMFNHVGALTDAALSPTIPLILFAMFQLKFAIITPALITGAFAERIRFSAFLLFIILFCLFIYCPLAHWTWHPNGFLRNWGVLDFAGGTVVHISAGFAALAGAIVMGNRRNQGSHSEPGNIPFILLGTGMLWFGWFGFNAGSTLSANELASQAFLNTNTASAAAMLTWIFFDGINGRKPSAAGACIGAVVGLVAITPAAGYVTVGASLFIGVFSSVVSNLAVKLKTRSTLDDTLDVFPCHGVGGIVGMLLTGVFATTGINPAGANGLMYGGYGLFLNHVLALLIVSVFTFGGSWLLYKFVNVLIPLRVEEDLEEAGLDLSQHGEQALAVNDMLKAAKDTSVISYH
ncbi:MAG: ammonium transporter [Bacteroidota bacterium]